MPRFPAPNDPRLASTVPSRLEETLRNLLEETKAKAVFLQAMADGASVALGGEDPVVKIPRLKPGFLQAAASAALLLHRIGSYLPVDYSGTIPLAIITSIEKEQLAPGVLFTASAYREWFASRTGSYALPALSQHTVNQGQWFNVRKLLQALPDYAEVALRKNDSVWLYAPPGTPIRSAPMQNVRNSENDDWAAIVLEECLEPEAPSLSLTVAAREESFMIVLTVGDESVDASEKNLPEALRRVAGYLEKYPFVNTEPVPEPEPTPEQESPEALEQAVVEAAQRALAASEANSFSTVAFQAEYKEGTLTLGECIRLLGEQDRVVRLETGSAWFLLPGKLARYEGHAVNV